MANRSAANTERHYLIKKNDLPLCCPSEEMRIWNSHPRVYLPIEDEGNEIICPYCSAKYTLVD